MSSSYRPSSSCAGEEVCDDDDDDEEGELGMMDMHDTTYRLRCDTVQYDT